MTILEYGWLVPSHKNIFVFQAFLGKTLPNDRCLGLGFKPPTSLDPYDSTWCRGNDGKAFCGEQPFFLVERGSMAGTSKSN